jgi:hypothetical protein
MLPNIVNLHCLLPNFDEIEAITEEQMAEEFNNTLESRKNSI